MARLKYKYRKTGNRKSFTTPILKVINPANVGQLISVVKMTGNAQIGTKSQARNTAEDVDRQGQPALECHPLKYIIITTMAKFSRTLSSKKRATAATTGSKRGFLRKLSACLIANTANFTANN